MDDEYPRLLVDRDVMVVRNGYQQAMRVLDRVRPVATQVRDLVNGGEINCGLVFVRYFGHELISGVAVSVP